MIRYDVAPPLARIVLDRPAALNALDLPMVQALHAAFTAAGDDERVRAVVIEGAGGRAFCAGGDVRAIALDVRDGDGALGPAFFRAEYAMNAALARMQKPCVALWGGVVMGGGAGVSVHGSHRVATEATVFAMPETGIGFFPDVGATYFLPRCPGATGAWLALTGARLGAADLLQMRLATHATTSAALPVIVDALTRADWTQGAAGAVVDEVLAAHAAEPAPGRGAALSDEARDIVDRCFAFDSVEEILAALAREPGAFAADALATLRTRSPTSLVATLALLRAGAARTLDEALAAELRAAVALIREPDFVEGIRAVLIDKDQRPRWRPVRIEDVDVARVHALVR